MKKLLILFSVATFLFLKPSQTFADTGFKTSSDTTYQIDPTGNANVTFAITLENTTEKYYASSYTLSVGFPTIKNLTASDPFGPITPQVIRKNDLDSITVVFNKRSTGFGSKLPFTISFDTPDVAKKVGNIWEINIPGIANQQDFDAFTVAVNAPSSFGKPSFIKPEQTNPTLTFTKQDLDQSGISLAFGSQQIYHFSLAYHLANNTIFPTKTDIALPSNTNYQQVFIKSISPKPQNVREDGDGNWLATYNLLPRQKITVLADGIADVSISPKKVYLSDDQKKMYLQEQPYWQTSNQKIKTLARQLRTSQDIYQYVVNTLGYDFSRVTQHQQRLGAVGILQKSQAAVCLEFTDLYIALARAAGIPAREVDGYAYTENPKERPLSLVKDVLHAWPEYYDNDLKEWIMVDPTWGNTTHGIDYYHSFDFDHVAFVIKGINSSYPVPAGGYKLSGQENTKDVTVDFKIPPIKKIQSYTASVDTPTMFAESDSITGMITMQNNGTGLLSPQKIVISTPDFSHTPQTISSPEIPPMGIVTFPFTIKTPDALTNTNPVITIHLSHQTFSKTLHEQPLYVLQFISIRNGITTTINNIISNITTRAGHLFISGKKS